MSELNEPKVFKIAELKGSNSKETTTTRRAFIKGSMSIVAGSVLMSTMAGCGGGGDDGEGVDPNACVCNTVCPCEDVEGCQCDEVHCQCEIGCACHTVCPCENVEACACDEVISQCNQPAGTPCACDAEVTTACTCDAEGTTACTCDVDNDAQVYSQYNGSTCTCDTVCTCNTVCTCDAVGCPSHTACSCDAVCTCEAVCSCDGHCSCDGQSVSYWHPC
ncbi:hypothetical protein QUF90_15995 [Desulfococcaceae bacterium HSG9]|nr:hypothetical protein [Desulfococcaceae bacterium HSG9]